ncbi:hypothetical protein Sviol_60840 [Streptomyces violascens]|uniref:Uncharacterized protein n=1 Tax=Streptomyces violascens TaxID=67381 RepID=A0ABQ3QWN5_9ACTN|nr:hypothetical protein Sviol_60840 [Streptomyces violascens]
MNDLEAVGVESAISYPFSTAALRTHSLHARGEAGLNWGIASGSTRITEPSRRGTGSQTERVLDIRRATPACSAVPYQLAVTYLCALKSVSSAGAGLAG